MRERLLDRAGTGRMGGSLLFTGPDGVGKRRVALELAQRELCFRRTACGQCEGCLMCNDPLPVELPNLLRIAPEGKAGLIRTGAIRGDDLVEGGVIQWAHRAPPPGCHRWILVEDAHRLNGASANMLLKTLEEPPAGTHFLLVTHRPEAMLQTIRSRCERIAFLPLGAEETWAVASRAGWAEADREAWTALAAKGIQVEGDTLVRVPQGFDPRHALAEDFKLKDYYSGTPLSEAQVCAPGFLAEFAGICREKAALVKFLGAALELPW